MSVNKKYEYEEIYIESEMKGVSGKITNL